MRCPRQEEALRSPHAHRRDDRPGECMPPYQVHGTAVTAAVGDVGAAAAVGDAIEYVATAADGDGTAAITAVENVARDVASDAAVGYIVVAAAVGDVGAAAAAAAVENAAGDVAAGAAVTVRDGNRMSRGGSYSAATTSRTAVREVLISGPYFSTHTSTHPMCFIQT